MLKLFIQGTEQHVGKTTIALGLVKILKDNSYNVGYFKPISHNQSFGPRSFVTLLEEFGIHESKHVLNPIVITQDYIKEYLNGRGSIDIKAQIMNAFNEVSRNKNALVIEGAGHIGVGSILGCSNVHLAKLFNTPIILVARGGIGSTVDSINLNKTFIETFACELLGVVINKVLPDKYSQTKKYLDLAFQSQNIKCLGYLQRISHDQLDDVYSREMVDSIAKEIEHRIDIEHLLSR
jgi:dethiobiotin synthetase